MDKKNLVINLKDRLQKEGVDVKPTEYNGKESQWSYEIVVKGSKDEILYDIFKPEITIEDWKKKFIMAISGDGREQRRITTLHSSSLLALLFFSGINKQNPVRIDDNLFDEVYFEVKNKVFKNSAVQDKPSNIDIMLVSLDKKTLLFLESKFTEYKHNGKVKVSQKYHNFYSQLIDFIPNLKFCNGVLELGEGRNSQYLYGIKQMFSHLIGLLTEPLSTNSSEIKEFIQNAEKVELGSIVFNWDQTLFEKYKKFFNTIFQNFENPSNILKECLDNDEIYKEKMDKLSILPSLLSYQDIIVKNPSYKISTEIKKFYNL